MILKLNIRCIYSRKIYLLNNWICSTAGFWVIHTILQICRIEFLKLLQVILWNKYFKRKNLKLVLPECHFSNFIGRLWKMIDQLEEQRQEQALQRYRCEADELDHWLSSTKATLDVALGSPKEPMDMEAQLVDCQVQKCSWGNMPTSQGTFFNYRRHNGNKAWYGWMSFHSPYTLYI